MKNSTSYKCKKLPDYLCAECAKKRGGEWLKGKEGINTKDFCELCEDFRPVTHKSAWYFKDMKYEGYVIQ